MPSSARKNKSCVECDRHLEPTDTFRWVPPLGGVLCQRDPGPPAARAPLSLDGLKLLRVFFFNDAATTEIYTLSLHVALPISALPSLSKSAAPTVTPVENCGSKA